MSYGRQLIVSFVGLKLQDSRLGTQHATLEQVNCGEHLIVCHRALYHIIIVSAGFAAVGHKIEPRLI